MISVCIPVYNTDVSKLVQTLSKQASTHPIPYEIILLDDASTDIKTKQANNLLESIGNIRIFENDKNIGLACTRNKLGKLAAYPYLIFIDSDAEVITDNYWLTYASVINSSSVYFGGCVYPNKCPDDKFILRWKFGKEREEGVGKYFSCFNFMIPKDILTKHPFSEDLNQYGYEDALFGIILKHKGINIQFINNPLLHTGLDSADVYLKKVELSISNLLIIGEYLAKIKKEDSIRLLKLYNYIDSFHLSSLTGFLFHLLKEPLRKNLTGDSPSIRILDLYKLGYLCSLKTKK